MSAFRTPEEDASQLKFNGEFISLSLSEVAILLEQARVENPANSGTIVGKMLEYCKTFRTFKDRETVVEIRRTLNKYELHEYEVSQLINLVPNTVEEAKSHIPSLRSKLTDEKFKKLLMMLTN